MNLQRCLQRINKSCNVKLLHLWLHINDILCVTIKTKMISHIFKVAELFGVGQGGSVMLSAQTHMMERTIPSTCPLPSHKLSHMNATSPPNTYNKKHFLIKKIYSRLTVSASQVLRFQESYIWNQDLLFHKASHLEAECLPSVDSFQLQSWTTVLSCISRNWEVEAERWRGHSRSSLTYSKLKNSLDYIRH